MALDRAVHRLWEGGLAHDQLAAEPLVRSFPAIVLSEVMDELVKVALAERNDSVQTFGLYGKHPALRVRVWSEPSTAPDAAVERRSFRVTHGVGA